MSFDHDLIGRQARIRDKNTVGEIIALDTCYGGDGVYIWVSTMDLGVVRVKLEQQSIVLPRERGDEEMVADYGGETEVDTQEDPAPTVSKWDYAPVGYDWFAYDVNGGCFYTERPIWSVGRYRGEWDISDVTHPWMRYSGPEELMDTSLPPEESLEARPGSAAEVELIMDLLISATQSPKAKRKTGLQQKLFDFFVDNNDSKFSINWLQSQDEFKTWSRASIQRTLGRMVKHGMIDKCEPGWYRKH